MTVADLTTRSAPGSGRGDDGAGRREDDLSVSIACLPPLKVLLVSHAFPPVNVIGAVRVGKFAKHLHDAGHDVRVISAAPSNEALAVEIPAGQVVYAEEWAMDEVFDGVVRFLRQLWSGVSGGNAAASVDAVATQPRTGRSAALSRHYYALMRIPDARAGWINAATAAGYEMVRNWRPDLVIGSAPPNSSLIAAARIARVCGAPWIAELRDLWVDNPYYDDPDWRMRIDRILERRVLNSAAALVSVTPRWSATLRHRYRQPVACIYNGYVEEDFPAIRPGPPAGNMVNILYAGNIYPGYRDPSPLFRAVGLIGAERERIAIHFYGPPAKVVMPLAAACGVEDRVLVHKPVTYKESLALQTSADVLLLLQWNNEKDAGNIPAKFYEYLGARRPILFLGYEQGDLATTIRERQAGFVDNDPGAIAEQLRRWIAQKPTGIPAPDPRARDGMTRAEQNREYERFLKQILLAQAGDRAALTVPSIPAGSPP